MKLKKDKNRKQKISRRKFLRGAMYSAIALTGTAAYTQSDNLEVVRADVPIKNLPPSVDGMSIGVMADFHAGSWGNKDVVVQSIQQMMKLKPDIITLLGDFVDGARSHSRESIDNALFLFRELRALRAPLGVYAVLGNHDHWIDNAQVIKLLGDINIPVLVNENKRLSNGLMLAGIDDYWEGPGNTAKALSGIRRSDRVVLLSHNPDVNQELEFYEFVDLVLSGHTHGGQIRAPFTGWAPWVPCLPRYKGVTGLIRETERRYTFLSKGVGSFLLPVRLFCPPDIALLRLKNAG